MRSLPIFISPCLYLCKVQESLHIKCHNLWPSAGIPRSFPARNRALLAWIYTHTYAHTHKHTHTPTHTQTHTHTYTHIHTHTYIHTHTHTHAHTRVKSFLFLFIKTPSVQVNNLNALFPLYYIIKNSLKIGL